MSKVIVVSLLSLLATFVACTGTSGNEAEVAAAQAQPAPAPAPGVATAVDGVTPASPGLSTPVDGVTGETVKKEVKPYRTFITVQRYNMEQSGDSSNPISNVRIDIKFPNKHMVELPGAGQFWPIGNGQVQEINRSYELPYAYVQNDGFKFEIQMYRKGDDFLPCLFDVVQLSEFNRAYVCHTDLGWQSGQNIPAEKQDKEAIQVRVFTDLNSKPNEIPSDSLALK